MKKLFFLIPLLFTVSFSETVRVTETEVLKKYVSERVSVGERCHTEYVEETFNCKDRNVDTNSIGVDTLVGATVGVVLGHQIGRGKGRDAAKVIGGIGGAVAANQIRGNSICTKEIPIKKCSEIIENVEKEIVYGYRNCGEIYNQRVCKTTKNRPIEWFDVSIQIKVH